MAIYHVSFDPADMESHGAKLFERVRLTSPCLRPFSNVMVISTNESRELLFKRLSRELPTASKFLVSEECGGFEGSSFESNIWTALKSITGQPV